jgi:C-terminal processing protease CtpA/Prc
VAVQNVIAGSTEYAVGIREGDVIAAVDGEPVYSAAQAKGMLELSGGKRIVIEIHRSGKSVRVVLGKKASGTGL